MSDSSTMSLDKPLPQEKDRSCVKPHKDHDKDHDKPHEHKHDEPNAHDEHDKGCFSSMSRERRLVIMLVMTSSFFVAELVVGYATNSLALIADSFHMLSDSLALVIGLISVRLAQRSASNHFTYGWVRTEVVGALVNGVFLLATCLMIFIEAVKRFFESEEINNPQLLFGVGLAGLLINILGMTMFSGHGHSHSGGGGEHRHSHGGETSHGHTHDDDDDESAAGMSVASTGDSQNMNMHAVFLHVFGDMLGSVAVIVTALVVWLSTWSGRHMLDPVLSLVIVVIILAATIPLVKESALVLLQTTPPALDLDRLRTSIEKISGVLGTHELHVWSLVGNKKIASAHVTFQEANDYTNAVDAIKDCFHFFGIHSLTIQPEFTFNEKVKSQECLMPCLDTSCEGDTCCPSDTPTGIRRRFTGQMRPSLRMMSI